jgi:hypothetical protein
MLLLMSRQQAAKEILLIALSVNACNGVDPEFSNTLYCKVAHESHHTANASLNLLSDKVEFVNSNLI